MTNIKENNAKAGFTLQSVICDKYEIEPDSSSLKELFKSNYDCTIIEDVLLIIDSVFTDIDSYPVRCTTLSKNENGKPIPYNFILKNGETLSIRTNVKGAKVAPRIIGQAGFKVINEYFEDIYGKEITTQDDIKRLIYYKIDECFPIFVDFLLDADNIVWIYKEQNNYKYKLISGSSNINIDSKKENFTFTKDIYSWNESTTLKYKGITVAEIQVHKNRTFKFRFNMSNILKFVETNSKNNETLGITCEKVICDMFSLNAPDSFKNRSSKEIEYQIRDSIEYAFTRLPKAIQHTGSMKGSRGKNSKCEYDFILEGNKTLSVKTNIGRKVCPPNVGQPSADTCYLYFKHLIKEDHIDNYIFKKMVIENVDKMIPIYVEHLFDSDYLLRIYENDQLTFMNTGYAYGVQIIKKNYGKTYNWKKELFRFTRDLDEWNESTTLYYDDKRLGEFQVHNNRSCYKFRFDFENLLAIIK